MQYVSYPAVLFCTGSTCSIRQYMLGRTIHIKEQQLLLLPVLKRLVPSLAIWPSRPEVPSSCTASRLRSPVKYCQYWQYNISPSDMLLCMICIIECNVCPPDIQSTVCTIKCIACSGNWNAAEACSKEKNMFSRRHYLVRALARHYL